MSVMSWWFGAEQVWAEGGSGAGMVGIAYRDDKER